PLAGLDAVPVRRLSGEPLLLADVDRSPEFNEFVMGMCQAAGFRPTVYPGSVQSVRAAAELVGQQRCLTVIPRSCDLLAPGIRWLPLKDPIDLYPWSLLWRRGCGSARVAAVRDSARALAMKLGWLDGADDVRAAGTSAN